MTTENYLQIIIGLLLLYWVTDVITFRIQSKLYEKRTNDLKEANDIRKQTYIDKYKPTFSTNPSPLMTKEFRERKGQGIRALVRDA